MTDWLKDTFRKVHMDSHTAPFLWETGSEFNPQAFVGELVRANVDSVVIFAKDHHGMCYYDTQIGTKHPALDFDLLGQTLAAAQEQGLRVMVYMTVVWEHDAAERNPDWLMINSQGERPDKDRHWKSVCINSPYIQEIFWPQVREVVGRYPVDGMWFDIVLFWQDCCFCEYCLAKMKAEGFDPYDPLQHDMFNQLSLDRFIKGTTGLVKSLNPRAAVTYNGIIKIGARVWEPYVDLFEIEALPHYWGYLYLPLYSRYIRTLGKPWNGISARFHRSWGDFGGLKSATMLKYEAATMLANAGTCSIGDQANPQGTLEAAVYDTIGEVYAFVKEREGWCREARSIPYLAILADEQLSTVGIGDPSPSLFGATKALIENHWHFDILDQQADFSPYKALVLPDNRALSAETVERLRRYVSDGGKLLATGEATLQRSGPAQFALADVLGVSYVGQSPYSVHYLRVTHDGLQPGVPEMDIAVYDQAWQVEMADEAVELARLVYPATERKAHRFTSHAQAPPWHDSGYPLITLHRYGQGAAVYIAAPLFQTYYAESYTVYRRLVDNALKLLLPAQERILKVQAPSTVEATLLEQNGRWIVHLVNYHTEKRGLGREVIEEIPMLTDIGLRLRVPFELAQVYLAPEREELSWREDAGVIEVTVPRLHIHQMVVFEAGEGSPTV